MEHNVEHLAWAELGMVYHICHLLEGIVGYVVWCMASGTGQSWLG